MLLSDMAGGVTGEIHYVDAGYNKDPIADQKYNIINVNSGLVCCLYHFLHSSNDTWRLWSRTRSICRSKYCRYFSNK